MTDPLTDDAAPATASSMATADEPGVTPVALADGSRFELLRVEPGHAPTAWLYWVPAMGMPARHYLPLARALAARGVAVVVHEWRGIGSSNLRADRRNDWGYRELLDDLHAGLAAAQVQYAGQLPWIGGHSLGGQLGALKASLTPSMVEGLVLVASGSPYWRRYRQGWLLRLSFSLAPVLAHAVGYLPGRRIGFGGNEARGVIADWSRSGRTGRYAASGLSDDLEQRMADMSLPVMALRLRDDWLGPAASLNWLLEKMPQAPQQVDVIGPGEMIEGPADHFAWMKSPEPVASRVAEWLATRNTAFARSEPPDA
jgi:predicted alpha/beta hydrolase